MRFFDSFVDELQKTAARTPAGALHRLRAKLPGALGLTAVAGGGAAVGHALGRKKGERQGIEEGAAAAGDVAARAYRTGLQRGALAMREALIHGSE